MSEGALAWAWGQRTGSAGAKAVLLALACHSAGGLCRFNAQDLARLTDLAGADAVLVALDALERRGLVRREADGERGKPAVVVTLRLPGAAV